MIEENYVGLHSIHVHVSLRGKGQKLPLKVNNGLQMHIDSTHIMCLEFVAFYFYD